MHVLDSGGIEQHLDDFLGDNHEAPCLDVERRRFARSTSRGPTGRRDRQSWCMGVGKAREQKLGTLSSSSSAFRWMLHVHTTHGWVVLSKKRGWVEVTVQRVSCIERRGVLSRGADVGRVETTKWKPKHIGTRVCRSAACVIVRLVSEWGIARHLIGMWHIRLCTLSYRADVEHSRCLPITLEAIRSAPSSRASPRSVGRFRGGCSGWLPVRHEVVEVREGNLTR